MTYDDFQKHINKAGIQLREFAELVKMNPISIYNCAQKGEVPSHLAVIAVLLGEMSERGIDFREVLFGIDISPKKPRGTNIKKNAKAKTD